MTNERIAIDALNRCIFLPGSWIKRFVRDLHASPENALLTPKQRKALWQNVYKFRRQIRLPWLIEYANYRRLMAEPRFSFENLLDSDPVNQSCRLIYSDWLEEHGESTYALANRWMCERSEFPALVNAGMSYTSQGAEPINYEWQLSHAIWSEFSHGSLDVWHRTREAADRHLGKVIAFSLGLCVREIKSISSYRCAV